MITAGDAAGLPREDVEYAVAMFRAFEGVPAADDRWVLRREAHRDAAERSEAAPRA